MGKLYLTTVIILFTMCHNSKFANQQDSFNNSSVNNIEAKSSLDNLFNNIDSIIVTCLMFGEYRDISFQIYLSSNDLLVKPFHNSEKIHIDSVAISNQLMRYINVFYLEKTEPIIKTKQGRANNLVVSTDYPIIMVECFKQGDSIINEKITIGDESFNLEFSSKFLEFYNFLENLIYNIESYR